MDLQHLIELSHSVGQKRPLWTQGGGGNLSCKDDRFLYVKASGQELSKVQLPKGIAKVSLHAWETFWEREKTHRHSEQEYSAYLQQTQDPSMGRPSMETAFHTVFADRWILHFHSLSAVVLADLAQKQDQKARQLLQRHDMQLVEGHLPGLSLARALRDAPATWAYILVNHGILLRGDSPRVLERWQQVENQIQRQLGLSPTAPTDVFPQRLRAYFPDSAIYWDRMREAFQSRDTKSDSQAVDLLWATKWMEDNHPTCAELSEDYLLQVRQLPTELVRKNLLK